jgi:putative nucleotidyltransferase with HDIG domain
MLAGVDRFFTRVDSLVGRAENDSTAARGLRNLLSAYTFPHGPEEVDFLLTPDTRRSMERAVRNVILDEFPRGVARGGDLEEAGQRIRIVGMARDRAASTDSVLQLRDLQTPTTVSAALEQLQWLLLVRFNVPSLVPDWDATEMARDQARAAVDPIKANIMQGQRVVPAREPVTEADLERYRAYQQELQRIGEAGGGAARLRSLGASLFAFIMLSLFGVMLFFYRPSVYRSLRQVAVIAALVLAVAGGAALVARYDMPTSLIPIAFPALVVAILWDGRLALNLSLILAILLSGQTPFVGLVALVTLVTGGAVASLIVRVVRRRAQVWSFIVLITGAYALISIVLGLLRGWTLGDMMVFSGWGGVSAVTSAFAAMGFLPLLEGVTGITTDQTLLELADANRPLLRRLSLEAPGTYAHSINVANLAEAAAGAIDANALLTRVGVYYHDVGKIERPQFFIENQPGRRNPHDRLKPGTSAQVVRDHVVKGVALAEEAKLPDCVRAFIVEHHGTQAISFFSEKARQADPNATLDPAVFVYPGPRPQSKETAIAMLADSVESAARALPEPSSDNIRDLVDRIVRGKVDAGQLDEAPLTLGELSRIKEQFVSVLMGMYHQRIDYPSMPGSPQAPAEQRDAAEAVTDDVPATPTPSVQTPT